MSGDTDRTRELRGRIEELEKSAAAVHESLLWATLPDAAYDSIRVMREVAADVRAFLDAAALDGPEQRISGDAEARVAALADLVVHCWIHSAYQNCGYRQMTAAQRALFDTVTAETGAPPEMQPLEEP